MHYRYLLQAGLRRILIGWLELFSRDLRRRIGTFGTTSFLG